MKTSLCRIISGVVILLGLLTGSVAAQNPNGMEIWHSYLAGKDPDEVYNQFLDVLKSNPNDAYALAGAGFYEYSRYRLKEASDHWIKATEAFGDDPVAELFLCLCFNVANERTEWMDFSGLCERLESGGNRLPSLLARARFLHSAVLRRRGEVEQAKELVKTFDFIQDFLVCGPFDNAEKRGHGRVYGPEEMFDPKGEYSGRNRPVRWEPIPVRSPWGYVDLKAYARPAPESTVYLAAVIEADGQTRARLSAGHAGALKVWVNGTPAIDANRYHGPTPDQVGNQIELQQGKNLLLVKSSSGKQGEYGLWIRLSPLEKAKSNWRILPVGEGWNELPPSSRKTLGSEVPAFDEEPPAITAMRNVGPQEPADSPRHFFYALLLDNLDVVDEADQSKLLTLTRCMETYPESALLRFYAGQADREPNRRRNAVQGCVDRDPGFLRARAAVIDSYYGTPYFDRRRLLIDDALHVARDEARFVVRMAGLMTDLGLPDVALGRARQAVALNPDIQDTQWCLAETGIHLLPREERRTIYERLTQRNAYSLQAMQRLVELALQDDDLTAAQAWTEKIRTMNPYDTAALRQTAEYYMADGTFEKAIAIAKEGLNVSPHDPGMHKILAMAYHRVGEEEKASAHLGRVLAVAPSDPWALDYKKHLSPTTGDYYMPFRRDMKDLPAPDPSQTERANYISLLHQEIKRVHPNGNSSETVHDVVKVLTDSGLNALRSRGIYYEPATEEVRILRARVWKKDGTFVDSPAPQHRSTANVGDAAARLYGDYNVAILSFPGLEKEATVELEYQMEKKGENIYADYFGDIFIVGEYEPTILTEYVLISPLARDFYYSYIPPKYPPSVPMDKAVLAEKPDEQVEGPDCIQRWVFRNLPLIPREPLMPSYTEILPYLKISTFREWKEMTTWWWNLSKDQFIPGPTVKQKVQEIVDRYRKDKRLGPDDPIGHFEKVRIVNHYVNTDVRYLGLEFGIHGYKPHRVDEICHAQYGDCKDKAALAVAMLQELGVEAYPVILRTTDRGEIDYELPSLGLFNHAIFYVPNADGQERWIDGTAQFFDATELPPSDEGSNSLIVKPGGESFFKRIPTSPASANGTRYTTRITLAADGHAVGERYAEYSGLYNPIVRGNYENRAKARDTVEEQLVAQYPGGKCLAVELSNLEDYSDAETLKYSFDIPNFGTPQGNQLSIPTVFFPQDLSRKYAGLSKREYDLVLPYRWSRELKLIVTIPDGWKVTEQPAPVTEETPFGKFHWSAVVSGNELCIEAGTEFASLRVTPEEYQAFRSFCRLIDNYESRRILLQAGG